MPDSLTSYPHRRGWPAHCGSEPWGQAQAQTVPLTSSPSLTFHRKSRWCSSNCAHSAFIRARSTASQGDRTAVRYALQTGCPTAGHGIQPTAAGWGRVASLGLNPGMLVSGPPAPVTAMAPPACSCLRIPAGGQSPRRGCGAGPAAPAWLLSRQCRRRVGGGTQQALQAFQQGHGLQPDAQLNPITISALGLNPGWVFAGR